MPGLMLAVVTLTAVWPGQASPTVFRAEAYALPIQVRVLHNKKPVLDLTLADFTIVLDKKAYVPVEVKPDAERPGYYFVNFSPPVQYRDGKPHRIEIKVRHYGSIKRTVSLTKPGGG